MKQLLFSSLFFLTGLIISVDCAHAQTVTGTVTDASTGATLPGVNIVVQGTTTGTATDSDGGFELTVPSLDGTLVITYIGYEAIEEPINGRTVIDVQLQHSALILDEMIVVGYGVQDQRDITGSISSIDTRQIAQRSPTNAFQAIQGQMAGVQVTQNSGAPGESAQIRIRGISTFTGAGVEPLFIVDGQPVDNIDNINPNDIESVEILKDGASAAIYGSRSANGVVLITTKRPEVGAMEINAGYLRSFSTARLMPYITTNQWTAMQAHRGMITEELLQDTRNQAFQVNNNHLDFYTRTAAKDELNFSVAAGTEDTRFFWNTGVLNQEGVIINTDHQRFSSRLNLDHRFSDRISAGTRVNFSFQNSNNIDTGSLAFERDLIGEAMVISPITAIFEPSDGTLMNQLDRFETRRNTVLEFSDEGMRMKSRNLRGGIFSYLDLNLLEGLNYTANFGADFNNHRGETMFPPGIGPRNDLIQADFTSGIAWNWIHESYLNFNRDLGEFHRIDAVGGFSAQEWGHPTERISGLLSNTLIPTLNNVESLDVGNTFTLDQNDRALVSFFGRVNYSYRDRYLWSGTIRRDGSSRFGPEDRWGNFPATSIGWRFSEEPFMDGVGFITDAKLRASYAITGNERIGLRDFDTVLTTGNFYRGISGVGISSRLGNPAIRWEETSQTNIGMDLVTLEGRLNFTVDYYVKNTKGLLADQPLPFETGLSTIRVNIGDIQNRGIEFAVDATPYHRRGLIWRTSFNISRNTNEVQRMVGGTPIVSGTHITQEGSPIGSFYGRTILGVFPYDESNAFTPEGEQLTPNFDSGGNFTGYTLGGNSYDGDVRQQVVGGIVSGGGDYHYKDLNGDFNIDSADLSILGNPFPKYFGGFRNELFYRNVSLSFLFDYQFDVELWHSIASRGSHGRFNSQNPPPYVWENSWQQPGDEAQFPTLERRPQNDNFNRPTTEWVEDASFIRLRNIRLSYDLFTQTLGLNRVTVYSSINNALTWTNYRGIDPELTRSGGGTSPLNQGEDIGRYPQSREFIFGINVAL